MVRVLSIRLAMDALIPVALEDGVSEIIATQEVCIHNSGHFIMA
jgi:hypothetical protein